MQTSEQVDQVFTALALAQMKITNPEKNRTVTVRMKNSDAFYEFKYSTLDKILEILRIPLAENGLSIIQFPAQVGEHYDLVTRMVHSSGQWIESMQPMYLPKDCGNQDFGSAMTYARRYAITSLLGLSAEEDDDANRADGNESGGRDIGRGTGNRQQTSKPSTASAAKQKAEQAKAVADAAKPATPASPIEEENSKLYLGLIASIKSCEPILKMVWKLTVKSGSHEKRNEVLQALRADVTKVQMAKGAGAEQFLADFASAYGTAPTEAHAEQWMEQIHRAIETGDVTAAV